MFDLIIIGAGPAGVSAAVYADSRRLDTLIIEKNKVGGLIGNVSTVTHYGAVSPEETGNSFAAALATQLERTRVSLRHETVTSVSLLGVVKNVHTDKGTYEGKKVIIAGGSTAKIPPVVGAERFLGKSFALNAQRDGEKYAGKHVFVLGGADGAAKEALFLSRFASKVTMLVMEPRLDACKDFASRIEANEKIEVLLGRTLAALEGENEIRTLIVHTTNGEERIQAPGAGIFSYIGSAPNTDIYPELSLVGGYIPVNEQMETAIEGVYAVGDIRVKQVRQVATAVADGAIAAIHAAKTLG